MNLKIILFLSVFVQFLSLNGIDQLIGAQEIIEADFFYRQNHAASDEYAIELYLELLKNTILNTIYDPNAQKELGTYWPKVAHSMIGKKRMNNLIWSMQYILKNHIPGDFIETGVWQGGATIMMRGVLKAYKVTDRYVWVADSFQGLPAPSHAYDLPLQHLTSPYLAVSLEQVKANFAAYGLLDDQVKFIKGWFKDTMPTAPVRHIAILRLDGDLYDSTMQVIENLYDRVSIGGFIIVDDYFLPGCATAIQEFRKKRNITDAIIDIDGSGAYWQKTQ